MKNSGPFERVCWVLLQNTKWKDASFSFVCSCVCVCARALMCVFFHLSFMCMNRHFMASQHFIAWFYIQLLWLRIKLKAWLYYFGFKTKYSIPFVQVAWSMREDSQWGWTKDRPCWCEGVLCQGPDSWGSVFSCTVLFVYFYGLMIFLWHCHLSSAKL